VGAEVTRIAGDLEKGLRRSAEQDLVDQFLVRPGNGGNLLGHREHDVKVRNRQQFIGSRFQPPCALVPQARWAVPTAAAVVSGVLGATAVAAVQMAPERRGMTASQCREDGLLSGCHRIAVARVQGSAKAADDVAQRGRRVGHAGRPGSERRGKLFDQVQRAARGHDEPTLHVGIDRGRRQRGVTQQCLHGADVGARF
jgi:hypothetical protein